MLSEFSDFFRTPYVDQHAKEVPKNIVFGGAPFRCPAKAFKDTVPTMRQSTLQIGICFYSPVCQGIIVKSDFLKGKNILTSFHFSYGGGEM